MQENMGVTGVAFLIVVFDVVFLTNGIYFHKYSSRKEINVYGNTTLMVLETSNIGCNVACVQTSLCVSFFYKESVKQCILQSTHAVTEPQRYGQQSDFQFWCSDHRAPSTIYRDCPVDYHFDGLRSRSCYKFTRLPRETASNASIICEGESAHLVYVETLEELTHIKSIFNGTSDEVILNNYWTGARRDGDSWTWGIGGEAVAEILLPAKIKQGHLWMKIQREQGYNLTASNGRGTSGFICEFDQFI